MTESFRIPYPPTPAGRKKWSKRFGLNAYYSGKHWAQRKEDADYWHTLVRSEMERQKVRRRPFEKPVVLAFYFNDRLDCSNHAMYVKFIEDGMIGRLLVNDSRRWVKGIQIYFHDEDYIKVVVSEQR